MAGLLASRNLVVGAGRKCLRPVASIHRQLCSEEQSESLTEQLDRDGFVIVRNAVNSDLVREIQGHVDFLLKRYPELPPEHLHHPLIEYDAFWMRVASEPALLDLASQFIGDDIALFASHYFCKMPRKGKRVRWHQDGAYWFLKPMKVVSMWLAVDKSDTTNGCLQVVRGSHKQPLQELTPSVNVGNDVLSSYTDVKVKKKDVVDIELQPGDVEIHHPNIIHGSKANKSDRRRCGLTLRYIPTTTQVYAPALYDVMSPWHMRGQVVPNVNQYATWPAFHPSYSYIFNGCAEWNQKPNIFQSAVDESRLLTEAAVKKLGLRKVQRIIDDLQATSKVLKAKEP